MSNTQTYKAVLKGNRLEWIEEVPDLPPTDQPIPVQVIILASSERQISPETRGQLMAAALERLAARGGIVGIDDPSAWQREIRQDRPLPGREE